MYKTREVFCRYCRRNMGKHPIDSVQQRMFFVEEDPWLEKKTCTWCRNKRIQQQREKRNEDSVPILHEGSESPAEVSTNTQWRIPLQKM